MHRRRYADTLAARVFAAECEAYPEAIRLIAEDRVSIEGRRVRIRPIFPISHQHVLLLFTPAAIFLHGEKYGLSQCELATQNPIVSRSFSGAAACTPRTEQHRVHFKLFGGE